MEHLKKTVYKNIRYHIITHGLRPGEQLKEKALMKQYAIGRTPLREVLIELQRDQLIRRFPRSGTFVAPLDFHFFKQVIEIRAGLEPMAAQLAADRITENQLNTLQKILDTVAAEDASDTKNLEKLTRSEFDFHDTLYQATHNRKLMSILHELHGISARFWHHLIFGRKEILDQFVDLKKVYQTIKKKQPDAAKIAMETHIQNFVNKIRDIIL